MPALPRDALLIMVARALVHHLSDINHSNEYQKNKQLALDIEHLLQRVEINNDRQE